MMRWFRRIFYWPVQAWHDYQYDRFWDVARRQQQAHRRLEWALKQTPDKDDR